MPVPLNPFVDVTRAWLTECCGYLVNDSVPVLPVQKTPTPSDIDLVAIRLPGEPPRPCFAKLEPNLLVECKGWFDSDSSHTGFFRHLELNLDLLGEDHYLQPKKLRPRKGGLSHFLTGSVYVRESVEIKPMLRTQARR